MIIQENFPLNVSVLLKIDKDLTCHGLWLEQDSFLPGEKGGRAKSPDK